MCAAADTERETKEICCSCVVFAEQGAKDKQEKQTIAIPQMIC